MSYVKTESIVSRGISVDIVEYYNYVSNDNLNTSIKLLRIKINLSDFSIDAVCLVHSTPNIVWRLF